MNRLSLAMASLLLSVSAFGCLHKGGSRGSDAKTVGVGDSQIDATTEVSSRPLPAAPVSSAPPVSPLSPVVENGKSNEIQPGPDCKNTICTMDLRVNVCTVGDRLLKGANKCTAINEIRSERCEANEAFSLSDVKCLSDKDADICGEQFFCNRDIRITECTYTDSKTNKVTVRKANNECIAKKELKIFACKDNPQAFNLNEFNKDAKCNAVTE
ncbi:MAG: hypothetical protein EOP10_21975 [Proteobacteria bacterium]|nr:MAG: hypothetical protein EOP10_21975 [Pseudomonadota bacterium]